MSYRIDLFYTVFARFLGKEKFGLSDFEYGFIIRIESVNEREEYHAADKNSFIMTMHHPDFLNRISEFCHIFFLHRQIS